MTFPGIYIVIAMFIWVQVVFVLLLVGYFFNGFPGKISLGLLHINHMYFSDAHAAPKH